ncbi:ABC transporter ATP-binding protein [Dactylosporangium fulvum]|uniref:ATP-binding cassette domain-containing protein n=1 Tax=Dactylosporangium fulvum TaxID=53359 RepID=A0ABY5VST1_9ACTN|nr:oligopeptide/dipeptide ABC transporter ATP-binding protein [Dactylosporangium fulvum]UWP80214.1 ATP-binding cassette domain-containing protein [Dactylosporangium fulvum]
MMAGTGKAHLQDQDVLLRVEDLVVEYATGRGKKVHAVSGISFDIARGETLGFVGESGCGKSTTGRAVLQLPAPTSGSVVMNGVDLTTLPKQQMRQARTHIQMIFQDPLSALNPRRRVRDIVREPLSIWRPGDRNSDERVDELLEQVGLDPAVVGGRRPHEFSGGQCQRIGIARALIMEPSLLVCDEPVSALDVSVQAQILNLLEDMKQKHQLSMMFIAHDVAVVKSISDRVAVMYLGKLCEIAPADTITTRAAHPYTKTLLDAVPIADPDVVARRSQTAPAEAPSPIAPPSGCRFRTRCPQAQARCAEEEPVFRKVADRHFVACHYPNVPVPDTSAATENGEGSG